MQVGGLIRSYFSSPHILSVPTLAIKPNIETSYYVGLFEFAQGSSPRILWDNQSKSVPNKDSLLLYVVNTPTDFNLNEYNPKPTIIKSEFSGIFFIAVYILIPDYEARGFTRQIVLLLGHPLQKMINFVFQHSLQEFVSFALKLQDNANKRFPMEISNYTINLKKTIQKHPESEKLLQSKVDELERTLKAAGIDENLYINKNKEDNDENLTPEYFTRINNELRPIKKLTAFSDIEDKILDYINSLPSSSLQCNAQLRTDKAIFPLVNASLMQDAPELQSLIKSKQLFDALYTLYIGNSLYIVGSENPSHCATLGNKIAALSPFDEQFPVIDISTKNKSNSSDKLTPNIILTMSFDQESDPKASCIDLDTESYTGIKCPQDSILYKELSKISIDHSMNVLLMLYGNETKKIGNNFIRKTLEMSSRAKQTKERMLIQMISIGFSLSDEPMLKYFSQVITENPSIDSSSIECFL